MVHLYIYTYALILYFTYILPIAYIILHFYRFIVRQLSQMKTIQLP
jgi:hypothetical protein